MKKKNLRVWVLAIADPPNGKHGLYRSSTYSDPDGPGVFLSRAEARRWATPLHSNSEHPIGIPVPATLTWTEPAPKRKPRR